MASDEARREVRSILRRLRAHGRRLPLLDAEWTVEEEHHWWCEVRPQFVLDHLREPWTVSEDDRRCWTPAACDAHYATVQWRIWNIGTVLLQYPSGPGSRPSATTRPTPSPLRGGCHE